MVAPGDGGPGSGGTVATGGRAGTSGTTGRGGTGGSPTGTAGTGGTGSAGTSGNCALPADAGPAGGTCTAMFDFETGTENVMINAPSMAFTSLMKSSAYTFCGTGALAIASTFSGTSGNTIKGEVLLPLPNNPIDLTGKMITVHVASDPGCSTSMLNMSMVVNTQSGPIYFTPSPLIRPITTAWSMATVTVPADPKATAALNVSLQFFSSDNYQGTIYVDEVDIK